MHESFRACGPGPSDFSSPSTTPHFSAVGRHFSRASITQGKASSSLEARQWRLDAAVLHELVEIFCWCPSAPRVHAHGRNCLAHRPAQCWRWWWRCWPCVPPAWGRQNFDGPRGLPSADRRPSARSFSARADRHCPCGSIWISRTSTASKPISAAMRMEASIVTLEPAW